MSIELPKQPHDGRPRHCYKCKVPFTPRPASPHARQCEACRTLAKTNPLRVRPRGDDHTNAWDSRSLAVMEAAYLRNVWRPNGGSFVTGNCNE